LNWHPSKFEFEKSMPVGAFSRALDNSRAYELLGWKPRFSLREGLEKTIDWYLQTHKVTGKVNQKILVDR